MTNQVKSEIFLTAIENEDLTWMNQALALAQHAASLGEVPVGCMIVKADQCIAEGYNLREEKTHALAHAELIAIDRACRSLHAWRLLDCTLYVTLEPCLMCMGAILNARIPRVVFGCFDPRAGACGSIADFSAHPKINHHVSVTHGVLADEARAILQTFFQNRRKTKKTSVLSF